MPSLNQSTAVITGASSGIGASVSLGLARQGMRLRLIGRNQPRLEAVAMQCLKHSPDVLIYIADIGADRDLELLRASLLRDCAAVDVLIHSAGVVRTGKVADTAVAQFDEQYRTNLRAPYVLTQMLLPMLIPSRGQVVFINSSLAQGARAGLAQYAASKFGLRALADALRAEVNEHGVRVLSVYPGKTATPAQQRLHAAEQKPWRPDRLLQPEDATATIIAALQSGPSAEITDIHIRPMMKS